MNMEDPQTEPRWLDQTEQTAWLRLVAVTMLLPGALEQQLSRDSGLTHFEYYTLAMLSEAPNRAMAMSALAELTNASASRLSHVVSRLEKQGWIRRAPSDHDGRTTVASLTSDGWEKVVAAAPGHVEAVREFVFDPLVPGDLDALSAALGRILNTLDPGHRLLQPPETPTVD